MIEKIKQAPSILANRFHSSKSPHYHRDKIHSLSPPQKDNNYVPGPILPPGRFIVQEQQPSFQPRTYQHMNGPIQQVAPSQTSTPTNQIRAFHSPPARPSSSYQP